MITRLCAFKYILQEFKNVSFCPTTIALDKTYVKVIGITNIVGSIIEKV